MNFLHKREYLNIGDIVEVKCTHQCNIKLMDDTNYSNYKSGRSCKYYGGFYEILPARISVPHKGNWNIVIDLGGGSANIKYSINIIKG